MRRRSSDLKIDHNHNHNFLGTTVRKAGKEGLRLLPLSPAGLFDPARQPTFLDMKGIEARSLQISGDGKYDVVTCNSAQNREDLFIYKLEYSEKSEITFSKLIHVVDAGAGGYASNFLLDEKDGQISDFNSY